MSITLITGVPGSGKTLKAVWDHLRPYVGHVNKSEDEWGRVFEVPSVVYTNINSLQVDHELIEGGGSWHAMKGAALNPEAEVPEVPVHTTIGDVLWRYEGNPLALRNWQNWAKPGAKIFFDEFQKFWPPRPNGAAVPPDIQTLDTHRHMGVDFVLITQNCRNVDRHILGLVDRHIHVRRVANMPLAVVYEWDHASVSLLYRNAITKSPWRYPKKAYKLYKSAELHTKQSRSIPGLLWFILAGFGAMAYLGPTFASRITDRLQGKSSADVATTAAAPTIAPANTTQTYVKDGVRYTVETTHTPPAQAAAPTPAQPVSAPLQDAPQLAGCVRMANRCSCYDTQGVKFKAEPQMCLDNAAPETTPKAELPHTPEPRHLSPSERDLVAFMHPTTVKR